MLLKKRIEQIPLIIHLALKPDYFLENIYVCIFDTNLNLNIKLEYCLRDKGWTWTGVKADSSQNNSGYGVKRRLHWHNAKQGPYS